MLLSLEKVLQFSAPEVVLRFQEETGLSLEESDEIFVETKRWLWACAKRENILELDTVIVPKLLISPEITIIDKFWHCFLLFTRDYEFFCLQFLGRFIHHIPLTQTEKVEFARLRSQEPSLALKKKQDDLRPQLHFLCSQLGDKVVRLWYQDFPKRFNHRLSVQL